MASSTPAGSNERRLIGRVTKSREIQHLPQCESVNIEKAEMSGDRTNLTFHCLHRGVDNCPFKIVIVQDARDRKHFDAYACGEHSHEEAGEIDSANNGMSAMGDVSMGIFKEGFSDPPAASSIQQAGIDRGVNGSSASSSVTEGPAPEESRLRVYGECPRTDTV